MLSKQIYKSCKSGLSCQCWRTTHCTYIVKLINHDCLPILMLLYIMLYIVVAYLMLFAALSMLFVCIMLLFLPLISANAFYFHVLSWFIDTWFVYFMY